MLGHLFYIFGFILLLLNLLKLSLSVKIVELSNWASKFKKVTKKLPSKSEFKTEHDWNITKVYGLIVFLELFWYAFGLLTPNWRFFSILIVMMIISNNLNRIDNLLFRKINFIITTIFNILLFGVMVINHFHLHYNLWDIFKKIF